MNIERDKFLTEAMGECWYEHTMTCGYNLTRTGEYISDIKSTSYPNDFSTWEGFGKLLEWCQKQDDMTLAQSKMCLAYLTPDRFADSIYRYLLKKEERRKNENSVYWSR